MTPRSAGASAADSPQPPDSPGLKLLVVDDEREVRVVLGRALARSGYDVYLATSGAEALAALDRDPSVDAVVSDITMPEMSGLELAVEIIDHHPGVPILFITGSPTSSGVLENPLVGLVTKPVRMADLVGRLNELIAKVAAETAAAGPPAVRAAGQPVPAPARLVPAWVDDVAASVAASVAEPVAETVAEPVAEPSSPRSAALGSWAWDHATGTVSCDGEVARVLGLEPDTTCTYEGFLAAIDQDDREEVDRALQTTADTGVPFTVHYRPAAQATSGGPLIRHRGRRADGDDRADGAGSLVSGSLDDTTAAWADVTEAAGAQRLSSLGRFASSVAHDVNNMLAVIALRADLMGEDAAEAGSTEAVADLAAILEATARASQLTQKLMLFAGQHTPDRCAVDLLALLAELKPELADMAAPDAVLEWSLHDVPAVVGDRDHLATVVRNLVRNAVEASATDCAGPVSGAGRPGSAPARDVATGPAAAPARIVVRLAPVSGGTGRGVVIEVCDHGRGMTGDVLERAVEPFFQFDPHRVRRTGLGLSVAYGIAREHGGQLQLESVVGEGTTVRVTLPSAPAGRPGETRPGFRE